jgi:heterodisulfide reductase subunit A2
MVDAARHPKVRIMAPAEVKKVDGYIGNFRVTVESRPRYVDAGRCNGCGACAKVCPIEIPNDFEANIAPRKAIGVPHGQAVPLVYAIDMDHCIHCFKCVEACGKLDAIDFAQQVTHTELEVGAMVVASGYDVFDPTPIAEYGYGVYPNVITALELERLSNSAGPTVGQLIRPSDHRPPRKIAMVQCVVSRDARYHSYCSGFCCMYTLKNAIALKVAQPELEITIFYMDIRTPAKGYEEFHLRAREVGIRFVEGRPALITEDPQTHNLRLRTEDIALGQTLEVEADLVVLATAAEARADSQQLGETLTITRDTNGFFMEYHPKLRPVDTPIEGIFLAGVAQGVKDIPASVSQGSAAASRAARILSSNSQTIEPTVAYVWPERCISAQGKKCGICATKCPYKAILVEPGRAAQVIPAVCHGCGACVAECPHNAMTQFHFTDAQVVAQVGALMAEAPESKVMVFMCHWCSYGGADNAGSSHFEYPASTRGLRVMCSARMDADFVFEAFRRGAGMVLVSGCHPQDCHYITGQQHAAKRFERLAGTLEKMGISPRRFRVEWISAAEGQKYARVMREMDEALRSFDPAALRAENTAARAALEQRLRRWADVPGVAEALRAFPVDH